MKAVRWMNYGSPDALEVAETKKPVPKNDEVLVRVSATTVTAGDCEMRSLSFPAWLSLPMRLYTGVLRPTRITTLGMALAGEIEAVGSGVKQWRAGQRVAAATGMRFGSYAEYAVLPARSAHLPCSLRGTLERKLSPLTPGPSSRW